MGNALRSSLQRKTPESKEVKKNQSVPISNGKKQVRRRKRTKRSSSEKESAQIRRIKRSKEPIKEPNQAKKGNFAENSRNPEEKSVENREKIAKKSDTEKKSLQSIASKEKPCRKTDKSKKTLHSHDKNNVESGQMNNYRSGQDSNNGSKSKKAKTQCKIPWIAMNARPSDSSNVEITKVARLQKRKSHGRTVPRNETLTTATTESTSSANNVLVGKNARKKKSLPSHGYKLPWVKKPPLLANGKNDGKDDPTDTNTIMVMVDEWKNQEKSLQKEYENAQERIRSSLRQEQLAKARAQTWRARLERLAVIQKDRLFRQATLLRNKLRSAEQRFKANEQKAERLVHTNNKLKGMIDVVKEEARSLRVESEKKRETTRKHLNEKLILVEEELKKLRYRIGDSTRTEEARRSNQAEHTRMTYPQPSEHYAADEGQGNYTGNQQTIPNNTDPVGTVIIHSGTGSDDVSENKIRVPTSKLNSCFPINSAIPVGSLPTPNPYVTTQGSYLLNTNSVPYAPKLYPSPPLRYDAHYNVRPNAMFHSYAVPRPPLPSFVHAGHFEYYTNGYPARNFTNVSRNNAGLQPNQAPTNQGYTGAGVFAPKHQIGRNRFNLQATRGISNQIRPPYSKAIIMSKAAEENYTRDFNKVNYSRIHNTLNETQTRTHKTALPPVEISIADKDDSSSAYDTCSSSYCRRMNQSDDSGKTQFLIRKKQVYSNYEREKASKSVPGRHYPRTDDELTSLHGDAYSDSKVMDQGKQTPKSGWLQDLEQKLEKNRKYVSNIPGQNNAEICCNNHRTSSSSNCGETNVSPISAPLLTVKEFRFSPDILDPSSTEPPQNNRTKQKGSNLKLYSRRSKALNLLDMGKVEVTRGNRKNEMKKKSRKSSKAVQSC